MGTDFQSMCENGVKNHIKSIQFAMAKTVLDIDFDKIGFDEAVAEKIRKKLIECGFSVPVLGCYINPIDEDAERLEQSLRRFEAFYRRGVGRCALRRSCIKLFGTWARIR